MTEATRMHVTHLIQVSAAVHKKKEKKEKMLENLKKKSGKTFSCVPTTNHRSFLQKSHLTPNSISNLKWNIKHNCHDLGNKNMQ